MTLSRLSPDNILDESLTESLLLPDDASLSILNEQDEATKEEPEPEPALKSEIEQDRKTDHEQERTNEKCDLTSPLLLNDSNVSSSSVKRSKNRAGLDDDPLSNNFVHTHVKETENNATYSLEINTSNSNSIASNSNYLDYDQGYDLDNYNFNNDGRDHAILKEFVGPVEAYLTTSAASMVLLHAFLIVGSYYFPWSDTVLRISSYTASSDGSGGFPISFDMVCHLILD